MEDEELAEFRRRSGGSAALLPLRAHLIYWNRVGIIGFSSTLVAGLTYAFLPAGILASILAGIAFTACAVFLAALFKIMTFVCPNCGRLYSWKGFGKKSQNNGRQCCHCMFDLFSV